MVKFNKDVHYKFLLWVDIMDVMDERQAQNVRRAKLDDGYAKNTDLISRDIQVEDHTCWHVEIGGIFEHNVSPDPFNSKPNYAIKIQFASKDTHITIPVRFDSSTKYDNGVIQSYPRMGILPRFVMWLKGQEQDLIRLHMDKRWCQTEYEDNRKVISVLSNLADRLLSIFFVKDKTDSNTKYDAEESIIRMLTFLIDRQHILCIDNYNDR